MIKEYSSIEEFIMQNKRLPTTDESKRLYDLLWNKYLLCLNDEDKKVAIANSEIKNQHEYIQAIALATDKFKKVMATSDDILSIFYGERWGMYSIYVRVNCLRQKQLGLFRKSIPNFYEGFEIKILPTTVFMKLFNVFKKALLLK